jgi:tetratricopeptide (TPR) repeat protein
MIAAVVLVLACVICQPGHVLADTGLADTDVDLFTSGDDAAARLAFEARLATTPDDATALYYLGRLTPQDGKAARHFERLLEVAPDHALADDALLALAESAYASPMGLFITARRLYRRLLDHHPQSEHRDLALYRLGKTFLITEQPDSAVAYFAQVGGSAASDLRSFARLSAAEALMMAGGDSDPPASAPVYPFDTSGPAKAPDERPESGDSAYWIQAGAFRREAGAKALAERLRIAKLSVERWRNARGLIVLRVGPFENREEAVRIVHHLKDVEHIDAMVIAP